MMSAGVAPAVARRSFVGAAEEYQMGLGTAVGVTAACKRVRDADEQCVNDLLQVGESRGRWSPLNQCQSFVIQAMSKCSPRKRSDRPVGPTQ